MPHEKPRLEATLAGFDNRSRGLGAPRRCHAENVPPKIRAVCPLCDLSRVKIS